MPAHEPANTASKRESANPRVGDDPAGRGEAEDLRLAVEFSPQHPRLSARGSAIGIEFDALHRGKIHDEAIVAERSTRDIVPAAADRKGQSFCAREVDAGDDISRTTAAHDEGGSAINHAIPDLASIVIARIS